MEIRELLTYLGAEVASGLVLFVMPSIYMIFRRVSNKFLFLSSSIGACYLVQLAIFSFVAPFLAANYLLIPKVAMDESGGLWIPLFIAIESVSEYWFIGFSLVSLAIYLYVPCWLHRRYGVFNIERDNNEN